MLEVDEFRDRKTLMAVATVDRFERETARKTIEDARESFGLTYRDLASTLDVTRRMLLRFRKEKNTPSPKVRDRLEARSAPATCSGVVDLGELASNLSDWWRQT